MNITRYIDDEGKRHYNDEDGKDVLSVTTILDEMEKPEELTAWQDRNDGEGDNADHEHLLWYKANRGTLLHYEVLSMFEDAHEEAELYSEDESSSEDELFDSHSPNKVYSILKDKDILEKQANFDPEDISLEEIYQEDKKIFKQIFNTIALANNINKDTVEEIERMFIAEPEEGVGYGGQIDMIYKEGDKTVVADLKTSSGVREKHLLQGAAYAKAVGEDNIAVEVIRIHPDSGDWDVKRIEGDEIEKRWKTFKRLAKKAYSG